MGNQKNVMIFLIICAFIFLVGGIILANRWVSNEIDQVTQVDRTPQVVVKTNMEDELKKPKKTFVRQMLHIERAPRVEPKEVEPSKPESVKTKSDKIIYEIPLDDLILVQ